MDSFKVSEVERMSQGGNKPWKDFFDAHTSNKVEGRAFEDCTIQERYDSEAGEEWKERLTAKVEGKEYVPGTRTTNVVRKSKPEVEAGNISRSNTPLSRSATPSQSAGPQKMVNPTQKAQNEAYFSRMGAENANRSEDLPPSQGGKFGGFGSEPMPSRSPAPGAPPAIDDFQKDPVAALTKGFGWLGSTVSKQANAGYTGWLKPNMQKVSIKFKFSRDPANSHLKLAESDLAAQARIQAGQLGQNLQGGTKTVADSFNRFVEGDDRSAAVRSGGKAPEKADFWNSFGAPPAGPSNDKKGFWDDFAAAGDVAQQKTAKPTSIGTSAMKKPAPGAAGKKDDDSWGDW